MNETNLCFDQHSLIKFISNLRVSSVANKNHKEFGKNHLIDGKEETCWSSDKGSFHWIKIEFQKQVTIDEIKVQFHGGYGCKNMQVDYISKEKTNTEVFYPQDCHSFQQFKNNSYQVDSLKITFIQTNDMFGRLIIYSLDVIGH